ncbi:MAG: preprotein translocase subunit SecE [Lachnospiraceae bacterium]|nr:preprotein translocase subunit SecE [Lachnospiraceae bacterium]MBR4412573.1 preprotein translocase subunit SecE [Lachnospiraceae bacterium]MBR5066092.1 preprotein translocase subunit SecE [Lachnospiraceae bacterium]MBR5917334.1 preprotein translocase subunit SecE [Lachnospiraceae bacterium]
MADTQKKSKRSFFKGIKSEFKKITWPTKDDVFKQTLVVTVITVVVALLIAAIDLGVQYGINFLTGL